MNCSSVSMPYKTVWYQMIFANTFLKKIVRIQLNHDIQKLKCLIGFDSRFWNMRRRVQTCLHIHDFIMQSYLNNTDVNQNSGYSFHYVWRLIYARVIGEEISMFLDVTSHPYNILTLKIRQYLLLSRLLACNLVSISYYF